MEEKGTKPKRWLKLVLIISLVLTIGIVLFFMLWPFMAAGEARAELAVKIGMQPREMEPPKNGLRIICQNLAHGRGPSGYQGGKSRETMDRNLEMAADMCVRENAHIVLLQEADGPSFWSQEFNHIEALAREGGFGYFVHMHSVDGLGLSYGTGIMSMIPPFEARGMTFKTRAFHPPKGAAVITVPCPVYGDVMVDLVSVHLDHLSTNTRLAQVDELIDRFRNHARPLIMGGDFNCTWNGEGTLPKLCRALDLTVYQPESKDLGSFRSNNKRIDWVLLSNDLEFIDYRLLEDEVSDHKGILVEVGIKASRIVID